MKNTKFIATSEKVKVDDYIEFDIKKGYRHCTQTINPKSGALNKPKKSTYSHFMLRYFNEDNHIKVIYIDFNVPLENMNLQVEKVMEIWEYLTAEERTYLVDSYRYYIKIAAIASVQYCSTDKEVVLLEIKKINGYLKTFEVRDEKGKLTGYNVESNVFENMPQIDKEALKNATPENYNPFTNY